MTCVAWAGAATTAQHRRARRQRDVPELAPRREKVQRQGDDRRGEADAGEDDDRRRRGDYHQRDVHTQHPRLGRVLALHERLKEKLHDVRGVQAEPVRPEDDVVRAQRVKRWRRRGVRRRRRRRHGGGDVEPVQEEVLVEDVLILLDAIQHRRQRARVPPRPRVVVREPVHR